MVFTIVKSKPEQIYSDQSKQLGKQSNEPIKTPENVKTSLGRQARENACRQATMGFGFLLIGRENGAKFRGQSQSEARTN